MKKIAFAIQVFGLIAMFPVYVVAEFNHGNGRLSSDNSELDSIKKPVKKSIQLSLSSAEQNEDVVLFKIK